MSEGSGLAENIFILMGTRRRGEIYTMDAIDDEPGMSVFKRKKPYHFLFYSFLWYEYVGEWVVILRIKGEFSEFLADT